MNDTCLHKSKKFLTCEWWVICTCTRILILMNTWYIFYMNLYQMIYTFKDMLSYKELNYDVYIYKSTETDYFITLFFINNYDEIWFICQLSISILKIQYEHVLLLDRFSKRSKVNSNIQNLIATTENSILFVFI